MEILGRLPTFLSRPIRDLRFDGRRVEGWRAGCIVTASGHLQQIRRRWLSYKATRLRVWWDSRRRPALGDCCELYFHQAWGGSGFLVIGYIASGRTCSLATLYCSLLVLDEVARIQGAHALVAEATNSRLSDRLFARWGWQQHCLQLPGRHFIKRFYGDYPLLPPEWSVRVLSSNP